jgi:hypothetical protein
MKMATKNPKQRAEKAERKQSPAKRKKPASPDEIESALTEQNEVLNKIYSQLKK